MAHLGNSPYKVKNDYFLEQAGGEGFPRPIGVGSERTTEVLDPGGSGITVLKAELQNGDTYPTADPRNELLSDSVLGAGETSWWRWLMRAPSEGGPPLITGSNFLQLFQIFGAPSEQVAPFAFKLHQESIQAGVNAISFFRNGTYGFDRPYTEVLQYDVWYEWTCRLLFDSEGWVELWLRKAERLDELVGTLTPADQLTFWQGDGRSSHPEREDTTKLEIAIRDEGINDEEDNQLRPQCYRNAGEWDPWSMYWGELRVGTEESDVIAFAEPGATTIYPLAYGAGGTTTVPAL